MPDLPEAPGNRDHLSMHVQRIEGMPGPRQSPRRESQAAAAPGWSVRLTGRLATWEADLRSGVSRWDPVLFEFVGLPAEASAPSFDTWLAQVHPDERAAATLAFRSSLQRAGRHESRFRLARADGSLSWFHHVWEVVAGPDGLPASVRGVLVDDTISIERVISVTLDLASIESLVAQLMRRMNGSIEVDSTPGEGSVLRIALPAAVAPPSSNADTASASASVVQMPAPARPLRDLLCVDDDPVNQLLLQELVAMRPGLRLHTAADGMSATIIARRTRPSLVFLDLTLPDFDGFDVLRRLRADPTLRDTRVIAMSASLSPRTVERARTAGFVDCWEKPIDPRRFLAGLDRWLEAPEEAVDEGPDVGRR